LIWIAMTGTCIAKHSAAQYIVHASLGKTRLGSFLRQTTAVGFTSHSCALYFSQRSCSPQRIFLDGDAFQLWACFRSIDSLPHGNR
jgi:hypothetical protein